MNVLILGATGMVGAGALREALLADEVAQVVTLGRSATGVQHAKLREVTHSNLFDLAAIEDELAGLDTCWFCLGQTSTGLSEAEYTRITHDLTLVVARTLVRLAPRMTFIYVSGAGTNEHGRAMWARVKGRTESALRELPFHGVYLLRPGVIVPRHGVRSRTRMYRTFYTLAWPFTALARLIAPRRMVTTETMGRAMLGLARDGATHHTLEARDLARYNTR